ncbi:hypothetical protein LshimejAT787_1104880 [Lyophyllum shimeji]|uniref:Uncharacterized protein n=1 Tax=Lyophyllum shimeji TaxID=47721 RepID=A0A9P3URA6_LYOSH|nr:hypothetical protein LshimejAT787_1104880 [Lyophyllum shimeji]
MFVPFISVPSNKRSRKLYRRKGGGGGGRGGGGGGKGGGSSGGGGAGTSRPASVNAGGTTKQATSYGSGGGRPTTIPAGQPFAGRESGGGTRNQVYGTQQYGSGYPGIAGRGVAGRGFPFVFWPIAWGGIGGVGAAAYLHNSEYGRPSNSTRPGGPMATATFFSNAGNTTYRLISDNTTVAALIPDLSAACSSNLNSSSSTAPSPYNDSFSALPQPEQTVQYYRGSTVALTLDGYNNTAALSSDDKTPDVPLPSNIDRNLLSCLNQTIGAAVPLVDGVPSLSAPNFGIIGMLWILWTLASFF